LPGTGSRISPLTSPRRKSYATVGRAAEITACSTENAAGLGFCSAVSRRDWGGSTSQGGVQDPNHELQVVDFNSMILRPDAGPQLLQGVNECVRSLPIVPTSMSAGQLIPSNRCDKSAVSERRRPDPLIADLKAPWSRTEAAIRCVRISRQVVRRREGRGSGIAASQDDASVKASVLLRRGSKARHHPQRVESVGTINQLQHSAPGRAPIERTLRPARKPDNNHHRDLVGTT